MCILLDQAAAADNWLHKAKSAYAGAISSGRGLDSAEALSVNNAAKGADGCVSDWISDLQQAIEGQCDFLQPDCYVMLTQCCLDKVLIHRLRVLSELSAQGRKLDPLPAPESITLGAELASIQEAFESLARQNNSDARSLGAPVDVRGSLRPLAIAVALITRYLKTFNHLLWSC